MPNPHRREKMITLRVSAGEYELLKTRYQSYGVRSVSELTRLALQRILARPNEFQDTLGAKLWELDTRIQDLESKLSLFVDRIES
jgi:hypothetical protein